MARLDRLGGAKEVAQVGAVIGREFSYVLLHAATQLPDAELQAALARLVDAELLYPRGLRRRRPTSSSTRLSRTRPTRHC